LIILADDDNDKSLLLINRSSSIKYAWSMSRSRLIW
jgi:hypothetical protein